MKIYTSVYMLLLFVFVILAQKVVSDIKTDRQALVDFASAVPHGRRLGWSMNTSICTSWFGVTCSSDGSRVVELRLPGVGLYGHIPENTIGRLDGLTTLSLRSNLLSGSLPSDILSLPSLHNIYLQYNNFSGDIPSSLSLQLNFIDLSFNFFTGNIPIEVQDLTRLIALNLENNSLTGSIPNLNLPNLKQLNLSNNHLIGSVPSPLRRFPSSSFGGNPLLCGPPLNPCHYSSPSPSPSYSHSFVPSPLHPNSEPPFHSPKGHENQIAKRKLSSRSITGIAAGGIAAIFGLLLVLALCCLKRYYTERGAPTGKKNFSGGRHDAPKVDLSSGAQEAEKNKLIFFQGCFYNFNLEDLLRASAEVLGKGSYGATYKAILEEGITVVVKRLKEVEVGKKEFEQQMESIGTLSHHPNIVALCAYYYSNDEKLLVYDFVPRGSLSALMHGNKESRMTLDWSTRLKIALGAGRGIAHIHSVSGAKITHGNIKSSNVLLTQDLNACISDFGLTPLMRFTTTPSRSAGYRAPEVIVTRKFTQKADVYSFGVLLLELLTGKAAGQDDEVVDLPKWVQSVVREEWTAEVFDAQLINNQTVEEDMVQLLQLAMACVEKVPEMRPKMDEVVTMIEEIRQSDSGSRPSSEDIKSRSPTSPAL